MDNSRALKSILNWPRVSPDRNIYTGLGLGFLSDSAMSSKTWFGLNSEGHNATGNRLGQL